MNSRYEIEEVSEFLEPVDKVPLLVDDEDDYQVSIAHLSNITDLYHIYMVEKQSLWMSD